MPCRAHRRPPSGDSDHLSTGCCYGAGGSSGKMVSILQACVTSSFELRDVARKAGGLAAGFDPTILVVRTLRPLVWVGCIGTMPPEERSVERANVSRCFGVEGPAAWHPTHFIPSGGNASDISHAQRLLDGVHIPRVEVGRASCRWLFADKGNDAESLRQYSDRYRVRPVISLRGMKRKPKPGLPRLLAKPKYRRWIPIERLFG